MSERTCPNGHRTLIDVMKPPGTGREYCPTCGWNDTDNTQTTTSDSGEAKAAEGSKRA